MDALFFSDKDYIAKGSQEHKDFHSFLTQYTKHLARGPQDHGKAGDARGCEELGIPATYHPRYRANFIVSTDHTRRLERLENHDHRMEMSQEEIVMVRSALHLYEDFVQKKKYKMLRGIIESRLSP